MYAVLSLLRLNAKYVDVGCLLGCGHDLGPTYLDSCFCRTDLAPAASSLISSCASHYCAPSAGPDASAGVSIYADYCHVVFPTTTSTANTITLSQSSPTSPQTSRGMSPGATVPTVTETILTGATVTVSSSGGNGDSTSGGKSLSRSDVIAVVMGILAVVATCLAGFAARQAVVRIVRDRASIFS
jgi:hypothetical protein